MFVVDAIEYLLVSFPSLMCKFGHLVFGPRYIEILFLATPCSNLAPWNTTQVYKNNIDFNTQIYG